MGPTTHPLNGSTVPGLPAGTPSETKGKFIIQTYLTIDKQTSNKYLHMWQHMAQLKERQNDFGKRKKKRDLLIFEAVFHYKY